MLRELATRADWDLGIDSPAMVARYSSRSRQLAFEAVKRYAVRAYSEGGMTWRGPLLFAARDIEAGR